MSWSGNGYFRSSTNYENTLLKAVVVTITKDFWLLADAEVNEPIKELYRMTAQSTNTSHKGKFPSMCEHVVIRKLVRVPKYTEMFVDTFEYSPKKLNYLKEEVMAVAKVTPHYLTLVGKSFARDVAVCVPFDTNDLSVGQLVMGNIRKLPKFVKEFKKNILHKEFVHYERCFDNHPEPLLYPEQIRTLTSDEEQLIFTRCASLPQIDLLQAQRFIQEPLIAAGLVENFISHQDALKFEVLINYKRLEIDEQGNPLLSFVIDESKYYQLFQKNSTYAWTVGGHVTVAHKEFFREEPEKKVNMKIRSCTARAIGYEIELRASKCSYELIKTAFAYSRPFNDEKFRITTAVFHINYIIKALRTRFDNFFCERRKLFDLCTGKEEKAEAVEIPDRNQPFVVNGKLLDSTQADLIRSAAFIRGFTCANAPPGCGKTHSIAALVFLLKQMRVEGGICISGPTNATVTNAADAVATLFPDTRITRDYSKKIQVGMFKTTRKAVNFMDFDAGKYLDLNGHHSLSEEVEKMKIAQERINEQATNLCKQPSPFHNYAYFKMEPNVKKSFVQDKDFHVHATTVELLCRLEDNFKERPIRRLILDDAAQISPVEAMALYCSFPHLEYITLLGDMKQLRPRSFLPNDSACYKLNSEGELARMYKVSSTTKKELKTMYRCHPAITEKFLIPMYGPRIKSAVSSASRGLAKEKNLIVAADESPCLLINVNGKEEKGHNQTELNAALDLIYEIVDKQQVPAEDVVVICYTLAQMHSLNEELKGKGEFGPMKTQIAVHTVDSFQGIEAKIVILLTTASCMPNDSGEKTLKFVADVTRGTVAVSRAQHALYILGHWESLAKTKFWSQFLRNMINGGGIVNRNLDKTDIIPRLRKLIKFSINETVEQVKVQIAEPEPVEADNEMGDLISFEEDERKDVFGLNFYSEASSTAGTSSSLKEVPLKVELPVGDLISFEEDDIEHVVDPVSPVAISSTEKPSTSQNGILLKVEVPVGDLISFD